MDEFLKHQEITLKTTHNTVKDDLVRELVPRRG